MKVEEKEIAKYFQRKEILGINSAELKVLDCIKELENYKIP